MIDTRKVQRRTLRFESISQLRDELARIEAAHASGTLRTLGNWSVGQILGHLAAWTDYAYDGYPMRPPGWVRLLGRLMKGKFLRSEMPTGFRFRGAPEGTYGVEPLEFDDGMRRLRLALARLEATAPTMPSPVLGPLGHDEWIRLHLNHAALHLGYLRTTP